MAYRKLVDGDLVRITGSQVSFTGRNAIVIDAGSTMSRVQVENLKYLNGPTNCLTLNNNHLKIRHEPHGYIVDGRIDHEKKSRLEACPYHNRMRDDDREDDYDDREDSMNNDRLIMQQLLERVAKLEKEMLEVNGVICRGL